ncbi:MAG: hypothetical protein CM15mP36_01700 [Flavobacteriales bacterium]|nr:MAG: hypothetical protein CM15mP36_01700 [Flavobacteriales bacterium]
MDKLYDRNSWGAGNFISGKGYQMATDSGATVVFSGYYQTPNRLRLFYDYTGFRRKNLEFSCKSFPTYLYANSNANSKNFLLHIIR